MADCCFLLNTTYEPKSPDIYSIKIKDGYKIWSTEEMKKINQEKTFERYNSLNSASLLNREYSSMYIEWWLHNIGYYITKPLCFIEKIEKINLRFKDVDLEQSISN